MALNVCRTVGGATEAPTDRQRQHEAAMMFQMRRHISQDDTINGSFEDLSSALGRVELPAQVSGHIYMNKWQECKNKLFV